MTLTDEETLTRLKAKQVIEALLFATQQPISFKEFRSTLESLLDLSKEDLHDFIDQLNDEYKMQERAFHVAELANGFAIRTNEEFYPYLDAFFQKRHPQRLSKAALEVLAIITHKQPLTRAQIEQIRGVDCSAMLQTLIERELVTVTGKLDAPGRPQLYAVTTDFLNHFGIKDPSELKAKFETEEENDKT